MANFQDDVYKIINQFWKVVKPHLNTISDDPQYWSSLTEDLIGLANEYSDTEYKVFTEELCMNFLSLFQRKWEQQHGKD